MSVTESKPPGVQKRRWKNILINPRYQIRYVFWINATGLVLVALYSFLAYRYISENYALLVELSPMTDAAKAQLYAELREIIVRIGGISVLFLLGVSTIGIFLSHKTAGPLYHFDRVFKDIRDGNRAARIRLRPGDDFQGVAKSFNEMMDSLKAGK